VCVCVCVCLCVCVSVCVYIYIVYWNSYAVFIGIQLFDRLLTGTQMELS